MPAIIVFNWLPIQDSLKKNYFYHYFSRRKLMQKLADLNADSRNCYIICINRKSHQYLEKDNDIKIVDLFNAYRVFGIKTLELIKF